MRTPDDNPGALLGSLPVFRGQTTLSLRHSQNWPTSMLSEAVTKEASSTDGVANLPGSPGTKGVSRMQDLVFNLHPRICLEREVGREREASV